LNYRTRSHKTISDEAAAAPGPKFRGECPMTLAVTVRAARAVVNTRTHTDTQTHRYIKSF